ncbi:MAG: hypothetical protein ACW964_19330, partial [Candidatus Hodarchaeales archaeon]
MEKKMALVFWEQKKFKLFLDLLKYTLLVGLLINSNEINAAEFGVRVRRSVLGDETQIFLDWIRITVYLTITNPPVVNNFGVDDPGTGTAIFWTNFTDQPEMDYVILSVNGTEYQMSNNGSYWIKDLTVDWQEFYTYQITHASDIFGNDMETPSNEQNHTFSYDTVAPTVIDWMYYPDEGEYGTFKANVTDSWGIIDTVIINVTEGILFQGERWAVMNHNGIQYINNTIKLDSGAIKFIVIANDTSGNSFTSSEHLGYVLIDNHEPIAENLTLSRDPDTGLLPVYSNNTLYLLYDFYDRDNDIEAGTEIKWYKNGVQQIGYNDLTEIPSTALTKGDQWNASVKPKDGVNFGNITYTDIIIIQNSLPSISNVLITPVDPDTTTILMINYNYNDYDGDSENIGSRQIRWYNESTLISEYNDNT